MLRTGLMKAKSKSGNGFTKRDSKRTYSGVAVSGTPAWSVALRWDCKFTAYRGRQTGPICICTMTGSEKMEELLGKLYATAPADATPRTVQGSQGFAQFALEASPGPARGRTSTESKGAWRLARELRLARLEGQR